MLPINISVTGIVSNPLFVLQEGTGLMLHIRHLRNMRFREKLGVPEE
jgi:hypothetical protein